LVIFSLLSTTGLTRLFFNTKNPDTKDLLKFNKIAGVLHTFLAIFMKFGRPKPEVGTTLSLKNDIEHINIINSDRYLKPVRNTWEIYSITNDGKYTLSRKMFLVGAEDSAVNVILLKDNNNNYVYSIPGEDTENKFTFSLDELSYGWTIRTESPGLEYTGLPSADNPDPIKDVLNVNKGDIKIWDSCVAFSLLTALFHFSIAFIYPKRYEKWIFLEKRNPVRWIEYFFTSSIMMVNLASVSGVVDRNDIISTIAMTAVTNIFGMAIEEAKEKSNYNNFVKSIFMVSGFISFIVPWIFIFDKYNQTFAVFGKFLKDILENPPEGANIESLENSSRNIRIYIPVAIVVICFFYFLFPAIQINQIISPSKYPKGEFSFIIASLVSKLSLNIGAWYSGNRPTFTA